MMIRTGFAGYGDGTCANAAAAAATPAIAASTVVNRMAICVADRGVERMAGLLRSGGSRRCGESARASYVSRRLKFSHAATRADWIPGSQAECPASAMIRYSASGQAAASSWADTGGHTAS